MLFRSLQLIGLGFAIDKWGWIIDSPGSPREKRSSQDGGGEDVGGLFVVSDPPVAICLRSPSGGRVVFVSVQNYIEATVDDMAEQLGRERISKNPENSAGHLQAFRLKADADLVLDWFLDLCRFWRENDFGMFRSTIGACALAAYRHRFMSEPPVMNDDADVRRLERAAYRGGETVAFYIGEIKSRVHAVDVTSLFPHIMKSC